MEDTEFGDSAHQESRVVLRILDSEQNTIDGTETVLGGSLVFLFQTEDLAMRSLAWAHTLCSCYSGQFVEITCLQP